MYFSKIWQNKKNNKKIFLLNINTFASFADDTITLAVSEDYETTAKKIQKSHSTKICRQNQRLHEKSGVSSWMKAQIISKTLRILDANSAKYLATMMPGSAGESTSRRKEKS